MVALHGFANGNFLLHEQFPVAGANAAVSGRDPAVEHIIAGFVFSSDKGIFQLPGPSGVKTKACQRFTG